MALDLITGHQGVAHISAEQISSINKAVMNGYGDNKVMRMTGGAITQNALALEIATGYWRANGFDIQIQESETHYIDPSTIGTSRIDNIYVELLQDIPTGAQRAEITIIMGEESASPVAPEDPTEPYLNTDILLDAVQIGTVTVTEGAMVFTDLTEEYDLVTPSELSAVQTLATNALGMIQDDSDAYSSSKAYAVGDLCIHDNVVYKCITACSAAAWSVNQNCFEETTLLKVNSTLKDALTYSESETICGIWTTGEPIYRRVVGFTPTAETTNIDISSWNLKHCISIRGMCSQNYNNPRIPISMYWDVNHYTSCGLDIKHGGTEPYMDNIWVRLHSSNGTYLNHDAIIIVEYLKF